MKVEPRPGAVRTVTRPPAWVEPTVSLPLLATAAIAEELTKGRARLRMEWNGQILERLERVEAG